MGLTSSHPDSCHGDQSASQTALASPHLLLPQLATGSIPIPQTVAVLLPCGSGDRTRGPFGRSAASADASPVDVAHKGDGDEKDRDTPKQRTRPFHAKTVKLQSERSVCETPPFPMTHHICREERERRPSGRPQKRVRGDCRRSPGASSVSRSGACESSRRDHGRPTDRDTPQ